MVPLIPVVSTATTAVVAEIAAATTTAHLIKVGIQAHDTEAHSTTQLQEIVGMQQLLAQIIIPLGTRKFEKNKII